MRNIVVFLVAFWFLVPSCAAQENDFSLWLRRTNKENFLIPWYTHDGQKAFFDARYNFDMPKSAGVFVGKNLKTGRFSFIPEAGVIFGKYNAVSPELLVIINTKRFLLFSQNQYSFGVAGNTDFAYHWIDFVVNVNKWLALGADEQVFKEFILGSQTQVDVGPAAKITVKKMYFRLWPAWSVGPANVGRRTLFAGIGYVF